MIVDVNADGSVSENEYDVCVVGAGPAGISLSLKLAELGFRVALAEGGDREITTESQDLYQGRNLGREYYDLDALRLRYLGGTSGHWGGQCLRLDEHDFEKRDDVELSGWPITYDDLQPYEKDANSLLNLTAFGPTRRPVFDRLERVAERFSTDRAFYDIKEKEPIRFGEKYAQALDESDRIDVLLNANVTDLVVDTDTGRATAARVEPFGGANFAIRAHQFVLAMGGIENSRFMLNFNERHGNRFGNQGDMVGRCFMEHPVVYNGSFFITKRLYSNSRYWEFERLFRHQRPEQALSLTKEYQREAGVLNATLRLERLHRSALSDREIEDNPFIASLEFNEDYFFTGHSYTIAEQAPNPASRVTLVDDVDRFGHRRAGLDWQLLPIDFETIRVLTSEVASMFIRTGLGRMKTDPLLWELDPDVELDAHGHHMGGLRMSETPETGVVDANCKVHGAPNLYVAGSAVFATSGHANPTYSIVKLALRLADHLSKIA